MMSRWNHNVEVRIDIRKVGLDLDGERFGWFARFDL